MRKFLLGIFCGLLLAGLSVFIIGFALIRWGGDRKPMIDSNSVLMLKLEGPITEVAAADMDIPFFDRASPPTMHELWTSIRAAATDNRIRGIALTPRGMGIGWAKTDELRAAIVEFRKSGKPVIAWLRSPNARDYYLATAADKIYLAEEDFVNLKGLAAELMFFKGTLDKMGVDVQIEHAGKYKDAGDMFSRTSATPETREVVNSMLDRIFGTLVQGIADGRKKTPDEVRALIDQGPFLAEKARSAGLIDGLMYEDQLIEELKKRNGGADLKKLNYRSYIPEALARSAKGTSVALIAGDGAIGRGGSNGFSDDDAILSEDFVKLLRRVREDNNMRGAIVRIDSPGGDALASDDILREMKLLSKKKPIVISMSDVAASGGYYIAATGDPIVAYPNTITGSIGVIYGKPNLKPLYDKIGISKEIFTRGRYAAIESDYGPMSEAARAKLREGIDATYQGFVRRVAEARRMKPEQVEPVAQGRAWLGSQGRERNLVDELGGFDKAIEVFRAKAKLGKDENIRLVPYPPRRSIWAKFLSAPSDSVVDREVRAWMTRHGITGLDPVLLRGGMMRLMPYTIDFR